MEARTDRRAPGGPRMPLDVLVQLTHEDFEEPFDADGVDVSGGGLALRADYLPEVGDRLRCRFDCPPEGLELELDGEVVWAHDAGERRGEFGLRFAELDLGAEEALSRLVEHLGGAPRAGARARLHLEAVATPIDAEILDRDASSLTVEQELPFLRLGMRVSVEGAGPAHGRLASVDLRVEDGVPRLLLVVRDEAAEVEREAAPADDTPPVDSDATLQDFELSAALAERPSTPAEAPVELAADEEEPAESSAHPLLARVMPVWARARAAVAVAAAKAKPALAAAWAKLALVLAKVLERGGPRARQAWARARELGASLVAKIAARLGRGKGKRRTTAAPPRVAQAPRLRRQREEQAAPPKRSRRVIALSVIAFAGVGAAVYALTPSEAPPSPAPVVAPVAAAPAPAPEPASAVVPEAVEEATPATPETATPAAAEPTPAEPTPGETQGRLQAPTYPSIRETAQRPPSEGQRFGADSVPNGRTSTIPMSQPVTALRGERQPDGFTVTIPGALALGPAAPIAAANPSVEQAMILNRGDHAVLTVRFVAGRNPAYRVAAQGRAIEITIGR